MTLSIKAARQRDIPAHTEYAMRCFLYSIEGAGTIRQVATIQEYTFWLIRQWNVELVDWPMIYLLLGPLSCQQPYLGITRMHCAAVYFFRLAFVRVTTLIYL